MKSSELKGLIKKGDVIIILSLVCLSALWFLCSLIPSDAESQVKIYYDGELYRSISLSVVTEEEIITIDTCSIKVTGDGVCFLSSDCPDGLCVRRGMMKNVGDAMACVPKGITVEITADKTEIDGIAY